MLNPGDRCRCCGYVMPGAKRKAFNPFDRENPVPITAEDAAILDTTPEPLVILVDVEIEE